MKPEQIQERFNEAQEHGRSGNERLGVRVMLNLTYDILEDLGTDGLDQFVASIDTDSLSPRMALNVTVDTYPMAHELPSRAAFFDAVTAKVKKAYRDKPQVVKWFLGMVNNDDLRNMGKQMGMTHTLLGGVKL